MRLKGYSMNKDIKIKFDQWADMIDNAKEKEAIGDLSVVAYRMAKVILKLQTKLTLEYEIEKILNEN